MSQRGERRGDTDFDTALSLIAVMPLLGLGTRFIENDLPMPNALYHELATWATINFTYTYKNEREVAKLVSLAREPAKVERLLRLMRQRLGPTELPASRLFNGSETMKKKRPTTGSLK